MKISEQIEALRSVLAKEDPFGCFGDKEASGHWSPARFCQEMDKLRGLIEQQEGENRQLHQQWQLAESHLALLVQHLDFAILLEDSQRRIVLLNDHYCRFFSIPRNAEDLIGESCEELADHAGELFSDPDAFTSGIQNLLERNEPVTGELLYLLNGKILRRDFIPYWGKGVCQGHLWVYRDETEKRAAERKLQEQKQFYEDILNNLPVEIAAFDASHHYLFVNPGAISDPALREWIIGKTDEDFCRLRGRSMDLARARQEHFFNAVESGKEEAWEESLVGRDGQEHVLFRKLYPVINGEGKARMVIGYSMDITERKRFEWELQLSEKRYRDLFNFSQAIICTHDLEGKLLSVNPALSKLSGYEKEELVGQLIAEFIPEEDAPYFQAAYLDLIRAQGKAEGLFRIQHRNGTRIFLLYQNYLMEEPGTEPYIISFAQDITERVQVERDLRIAKQATEENARAKEAFLAKVSHEIRTPMNGVLGIAGLLSKTRLDAQQQNYLRLIQESANNLLVLVNDVLDLEKIIAGKLNFEYIAFSLKERVEMCVQSFVFRAEEKELALQYVNHVQEEVALVGDPYRLSQVLNNLISNAIKFTEKGYVNVSTHLSEKRGSRTFIEFRVEDSGIGIEEQQLAEIFEPFVQAHSSVSRKYGGTGLGLSICRELIHLMGGKLQVKSMPGEGTCFSFVLPFEIGSVKPNQTDMTREINFGSLGKRRILVAEDVELNQYLARHIMESWGFEVDIAANGREAVEKLRLYDYDLVLMDIQMPEMDGIEATRQIRSLPDPAKASLPVVALTANALKGDSEKYLEAGMNDYLAKPFDEARLFMVISKNLPAMNADQQYSQEDLTMQAAGSADSSSQARIYDLSMVESISGGDQGFVRKMLELLLQTMPQTLAELEAASQEANWIQVGKIAHKMKSTIDSLGISSLREEIRSLEQNGKQEQGTAIPAQAGRVKQVMEECLAQIKKDHGL